MKRITQKQIKAAREAVALHAEAYSEETGVGPCGGIAVVLARAGWGTLAMCDTVSEAQSGDEYAWYPHYVVLAANGKIIDLCGEYLPGNSQDPKYRQVETIKETDLLACGPGTIYGDNDVAYWQEKLTEVL